MRSDLLEVTRQMATLIRLGYPLGEGLKQCDGPPWVGELAQDLETGDGLIEAMGRRPRLFSPTYRTLVEAALASDSPARGLNELCHWLESSARVQKQARATLLYPLTILLVAMVLGAFFLMVLVPEMAVPLAEAARIPWLATLFSSRLLLIALFLVGLAGYGLVILPPLGSVLRLADQVLWTRSLATLLTTGKSLPECLDMLEGVARDRSLARFFQALPTLVRQGAELPDLLKKQDSLHDLLRWCGSRAEKGDDLILVLFQTADVLEDELQSLWQREMKLAEPRLMVGTGVIVAIVILIAWLPIQWAGSGYWI